MSEKIDILSCPLDRVRFIPGLVELRKLVLIEMISAIYWSAGLWDFWSVIAACSMGLFGDGDDSLSSILISSLAAASFRLTTAPPQLLRETYCEVCYKVCREVRYDVCH